ncbi:MAG: hypothetical protein CME88_13855 [Hirschia sp.]|nr:hypothetical protein [Hirschia sp.]MBF19182.1 hypothetical protein [Hirschia sp.]MBF19457.1 hypothetical protein [Hirschia sp.]|tara:strand:- start:245 stop:538 length:294 start_codon:yes stop_codon:yes gene_type:complete
MSGGQVMVVIIVALVMLTGIIKTVVLGRDSSCGSKRSRNNETAAGQAQRDETLAALNARLDTVIDRLGVLEKIVTDEDRDLRRKFDDLDTRNHRPSA